LHRSLDDAARKTISESGVVHQFITPLLEALGWPVEVKVLTKARANGRHDLPNCYKLDIANEELKIAVEVDGASHRTLAGQEQDARKTAFLESQGWTVLRFWNSQVMKNLNECAQTVTSTTLKLKAITTTS
jgi:very-short-patch-repair endonuclease